MIWIILILMLCLCAVYMAIAKGKLWRQYVREVGESILQTKKSVNQEEVFREQDLSKLPFLLAQYIRKGGYLGTPRMQNMQITFHNTKFRMGVGKKLRKISFMQVNFVKRPDRHAFLSMRMAGILVQAKDSVIDGVGSMIGMLATQVPLFCSTGTEMDQGQLITALADAVFMPSLFLQDYITWKEIDAFTIEGIITWNDVSAKGRFTFDENGYIIRFDTLDRYMDDNGKRSVLMPWFVNYEKYREQNGYIQPGCVQVNWNLPDGIHTYFLSDDIQIQYNIKESAK